MQRSFVYFDSLGRVHQSVGVAQQREKVGLGDGSSQFDGVRQREIGDKLFERLSLMQRCGRRGVGNHREPHIDTATASDGHHA